MTMRIAEMLQAIASWLENPENEALLLSEYNDKCMEIVASSCVQAASILKEAAEKVDAIEPSEESNITPESIEELANIASAFDTSGDPKLKRQASVIDELLLTIAAPPNAMDKIKELDDLRMEELKRKYNEPREKLKEKNKTADLEKAIKESPVYKEYRILEAPLSTRYCPAHPGTSLSRIGEDQWVCDLDKKIYNFRTGYVLEDGSKIPGGSVEAQSDMIIPPQQALFDSREGRLASNKP